MTGDEFVKWVAGWVLEGDLITLDERFPHVEAFDEGTAYELENDEVFANYHTIVGEARRLVALAAEDKES